MAKYSKPVLRLEVGDVPNLGYRETVLSALCPLCKEAMLDIHFLPNYVGVYVKCPFRKKHADLEEVESEILWHNFNPDITSFAIPNESLGGLDPNKVKVFKKGMPPMTLAEFAKSYGLK